MLWRQRLRQERQRREWTLPDLADRLGVSPAAVGAWERGDRNPTIPQVQRWADLFGLRLDLVPSVGVDHDRLALMLDTLRALIDHRPDVAEMVQALNEYRRITGTTQREPAPKSELVLA